MVVLDTNIIIDHLRQSKKETFLLKIAKQYPKQILALSVISIQELYEGQSTKKNQLEQLLLATVSPLTILAYTFEVSILAGQIARDLTQPIEFADSAIAA
ncbi:MAG: PIN domain-containing protein, partial [Candidatus Beckwithbacteria bacterium]